MKTFFVFAGQHYYPGGGMNDFIGSFLTKEEADDFAEEIKEMREKYDWVNVKDN